MSQFDDQWDGDDEEEAPEFDKAMDFIEHSAAAIAIVAALALVFSVFVRWL